MLINIREEKRELVSWICERNMRERRRRRRVGKTRTERERGWANKGNKERMRLMAERSWHRATHSVVASKRTSAGAWASMVRCSQGDRRLSLSLGWHPVFPLRTVFFEWAILKIVEVLRVMALYSVFLGGQLMIRWWRLWDVKMNIWLNHGRG